MKKDIHPPYYQAAVTCACGNSFITGSTEPEIHVDICSACHPFFTGSQKFVDTQGRVEKFMKKRDLASQLKKLKKEKKAHEKKTTESPNTLREMLKAVKK